MRNLGGSEWSLHPPATTGALGKLGRIYVFCPNLSNLELTVVRSSGL